MKYRQGEIGRVFIARVDDGEDLLEQLKQIADNEKIEAGVIYFIGAMRGARLVVGPEECVHPPVPVWLGFNDGREVVGIGTMFRDEENRPVFHLHGVAGRGGETLSGCVRGESEVYLVVEVILMEIKGTGAGKSFNRDLGVYMPDFL